MKKLILLTFLLTSTSLAKQNNKNDSQLSDKEVLAFMSNCQVSALASNTSSTAVEIIKYCQCGLDKHIKFAKENPNKDLNPKELREIMFTCFKQSRNNQ